MSLSKKPSGFSARILQSAARIICLPVANKFHTCSLRSVFVHVHAAAKNDFDFFRRTCGELCEAFFDSLKGGRMPSFFDGYKKILISCP